MPVKTNGFIDQVSSALVPHRESLERVVGAFLFQILMELREIRLALRAGIHDRIALRPFTCTTGAVSIVETKSNEILRIQTVWVQLKSEKEQEVAFLLQVNGIPVCTLHSGRKLLAKELGFDRETFGGDLIVPRGSIFEIKPVSAESEAVGNITFIREMVPMPAANAGFGQSGEEWESPAHSFEHEAYRDLVNIDEVAVAQSTPGYDPFEEITRTYGIGGKGGHPGP